MARAWVAYWNGDLVGTYNLRTLFSGPNYV